MPKRKPVQGSARLILLINGQAYTLGPVVPHPAVARKAWRLTKKDGVIYDVCLNEFGAECSCPDFLFTRNNKDPKGCKHIAALNAVRLL